MKTASKGGRVPRIELYRWALDLPATHLQSARRFLSEDELCRADRFVQPMHRDRFVAARARMRQILAAACGCDPRDLVFEYGAQGKPFLGSGPQFSLSHSGSIAVLAVSPDGPVGVDIEQTRPIEDSVARHHFSEVEYRALSALPSDQWLTGFFRCWTRKEAVVKAIGLGLSMPLDSFDVTLGSDKTASLTRMESDTPSAWCLRPILLGQGWAGAVAMRTEGRALDLVWRRF